MRLNAERNEVVVGPRDFLRTHILVLKNVNWLGDGTLADAARSNRSIQARVRSSQPPQPATLSLGADGSVRVLLQEGELGVAAGQACVFYGDDTTEARVLGGGWIARALKAGETEGVDTTHPDS